MPRVTDVYAALPAITGKFELEYEGELRGADNVARDIIRAAVGNVFTGYFVGRRPRDRSPSGSSSAASLQVDDTLDAGELLTRTAQVQGLRDLRRARRHRGAAAAAAARRGGGLHPRGALRAEEDHPLRRVRSTRGPNRRGGRPAAGLPVEPVMEREMPLPGNKKKYYN